MFLPIQPTRTLTADVASQIERMIREGTLVAGQRLPPEHELIETMNVSRTVLREAVAALRAHGLLTSRRGAGVFVAERPPQPPFRIRTDEVAAMPRALELLEFRAGFEVECAGLAALRRTPEQAAAIRAARLAMKAAMQSGQSGVEADAAFHRSIAEAAHNPHFPAFLNYLSTVDLIPRTGLHALPESADYVQLLDDVHLAIEQAIAAGDSNAARDAMRNHFLVGAEHYRRGMAAASSQPPSP